VANIMMAIPNNSIRVGPIPFTLYRKDSDGDMVLFCKKGMAITEDHIGTIERMTLPLYISGGDMDDYLEYTFDKIEEIIGNKNIRKTEKVNLLHKIAVSALNKMATRGATAEAIAHSEKFVRTTTDFIFSTPEASMLLIDHAKEDSYFFFHSITNCVLCVLLARDMNCFDRGTIYDMGTGGLLLDIGIPHINKGLARQIMPFSEEQWEEVSHHPDVALHILEKLQAEDIWLDMVANHHERMDGSGYPKGIRGDDISLVAQVAIVADSYNTLTSDRIYQHPAGHLFVLQKMIEQQDTFSATVLNSLLNVVIPDKEKMQKLINRD